MNHKEIKRQITKQLKREYPDWKRLTKKEKRAIAKQVLSEVVENYDFDQEIEATAAELLGIDNQSIPPGILTLDQMEQLVKDHETGVLLRLYQAKSHPAIQDEELRAIDQLLDDRIINQLISDESYTPAMREFTPATFLRAELLKALKFPEISYRKFCGDDNENAGHKRQNPYTGGECKQNRAFIGLPLNRKLMLSHVQLSQFRSGLTFTQMVNLTVYILYRAKSSGLLGPDMVHCVDSSELAVECQRPLATLKVKGQNIRIYEDLDCDCGVRRNKRDKSVYVVGYRMHTLTAVNPETGHSLPLISLLAAANHHDRHFLEPLVALGRAIGLEIKLVSADGAYDDNDGTLFSRNGACLVTPPASNASVPENFDPATMRVTLDDHCEVAMDYVGTEGDRHEFRCGDDSGRCPRSAICPKFRQIPFDNGYFQRIWRGNPGVDSALDIRKNCERPFNLMKKREGLDQVRVRSQHGLMARTTFTTMATLLLEIVQTRKSRKVERKQRLLPLAA